MSFNAAFSYLRGLVRSRSFSVFFRSLRRLIRNRFCDGLFRFGRGRLIRNRLCYVLFLSLRRSYGSFGLPHGYAAAGRT